MSIRNKFFLYNCWYVAAWHHEITDKIFTRTILDEPIVFYRNSNGKVTALLDKCPHRGAPLSTGKIVDNNIQCGYHGFKFDIEGKCIWLPGQSVIPNLPQNSHYITWLESIGLLLGSLLCWFLGRYLNSKKIIIINEASGRVGRAKSRHTCWLIPFEYWSVVGILAIAVILFGH